MVGEYILIRNDMEVNTGVSAKELSYKKATTLVPMTGSIVVKNEEIVKFSGIQESDAYKLRTAINNKNYEIEFWRKDNNISESIAAIDAIATAISDKSLNSFANQVLPIIKDENGNIIGTFEIRNQKGSNIFNNFTYTHGNINDIEFDVYEILPFGKNNTNYVYVNDECIAVLENDAKSITFNGTVTLGKSGALNTIIMYVKDERYFELVSLITLVVGHTMYKSALQGDLSTNRVNIPDGLKEKAKPELINEIRNQVNQADLPENMSKVDEVISRSKNDKCNKIIKKLNILFVLIPIIIILLILISFKG